MAAKYFGTDGIRDVAGLGQLEVEFVLRIGRALRVACGDKPRGRVVIGADTRLSCDMIICALKAGLSSTGLEVVDVGVLPTPGLALILGDLEADLGVMVSASHNPMADNGIKVFDATGHKLSDDLQQSVEAAIDEDSSARATGADMGTTRSCPEAVDGYVNRVVEAFRARQVDLSELKIVIDGANGAGYQTASRIFEALGADVSTVHVDPDGTNINADCGALHPESLGEAVMASGAHLGVALDGDGDRAILVDENGRIVDGDQILAILALDLKQRGDLPKSQVVATVMSNLGLEILLREHGIELLRTSVGDRHVSARIKQDSLALGGEQSGHIIVRFEDRWIGDGTIAALEVAALIKKGEGLSSLSGQMKRYPQTLINVHVREKPPLETLDGVQACMSKWRENLGDRGRILLRYSGTESLLRVMVEGKDEREVQEVADDLVAAVKGELG